MVKLNDVIKELEGIKVTVKGNEIDLTGMTYLEFNRLARSNNAIVFDIVTATDSAVEAK